MILSLIVPCFNEQDNVALFYETCAAVLGEAVSSYELIFVNDGSRDDTWKRLKEVRSSHPESKIKLINLSRNFGKEAAIYAGLQKAEGDYVTVIDADLQQRPEVVLEMVRLLDENEEYDCVAAYQEKRREGFFMSFCKKMFYRLINKVCDIDFHDNASDFRTFRKRMAEAIVGMREYHRFSKGIFSWVGFHTHFIPYVAEERHAGKTSWSFWKLLKYACEGFLSFTTFPLRLSTYLGVFSSFAAIIYLIVVVVQKLLGHIAVPGYATIVVLILLMGGIQMIMLGMIGEYLARIYIESKGRPIAIEKEYLSYKED
ncbi:MAG: glycosyltransferase family 2 protein [Clostridia bacterium]|nr:glycosyltransferase family 2 protein [Clostridia bacterium]